MTDTLGRMAEERFGIKADPSDIKRLETYIQDSYGGQTSPILEKVFSSGEAAGFLTIGETYFFREPAHFSFLMDLLPSYEKTGIQICSAAVATGCEAYSIAMLIETYNKNIESPISYHIDAFDINPAVIDTANRGVYGVRAFREDGSCFRYMTVPYLKKDTSSYRTDAGCMVDNSLKKHINFFVHNLMDELPQRMYDIIFFRNAFIYFSSENRMRVLSNLSAPLKEGGILIMGVSETAGAHHAALDAKNRDDVFYFQKPDKLCGNKEDKCFFPG